MCILQYVKLIGCNSFAWIYGHLIGGPSAMGICAFFYIWNLLSVMVLHRSMVNWQRGGIHLPWVYVHSAYGWNLLGVTSVALIFVNWQGGPSAMGICAFCYMWNLLGVKVYHESMVIWGGPSAMGICAFCYMWDLWGGNGAAWIFCH